MGCLKNIFKAIILVFAIIGFLSIGGKDYVINWWNNIFHSSQESLLERAQKVGDFSSIGDEYEIDKAASALGYKGVLAEHKASGQKMIVLDSTKKELLTPQDFNDKTIDTKLNNLVKKFKHQYVNIKDLQITKRGKINSFGKAAPYVRFYAKANKLPIGEVEGIVAAVKTPSGSTKTLISVNEKGKYSQLIAQDFFKKIKE